MMENLVGSNIVGNLCSRLVDGQMLPQNGLLLDTQKEKLASVFSRCARWSYSTNCQT